MFYRRIQSAAAITVASLTVASLTVASLTVASLTVASITVASLAAQKPRAFNRLDFSNRLLTDRDDLFPNQATKQGTTAGDGLFKVLPGSILERHDDHRISGYRLAIAHQRSYRFQFGRVTVPDVQVYRTKIARLGGPIIGFKTYETLDAQKPVTGIFRGFAVNLPTKGAYTIQVEFDQVVKVKSLLSGQRAGLAILARGKPGDSTLDPLRATAVMRPSFQERHFSPGRASYSGKFEQASGKLSMYGMLGQPSPRGELYLSLLFENPTLVAFGSSAGGDPTHPAETAMGPGAFATDIASSNVTSTFGLFAQAEQYQVGASARRYAVVPMMVATKAMGPTTGQLFGNTTIRLDPLSQRLGAFFSLGAWGFLDVYRAGGSAGFVRDKMGSWASVSYRLSPRAGVLGEYVWIQGAVVDPAGQFVDTTNVVRITLN